MERNAKLPNGAKLVESHFGTIPHGPLVDRGVAFLLFNGEASRGYQTDYQRAPTSWYRIEIAGEKPKQWTFTGKNIPKAKEAFDQNVTAFQKACA